MSNVPNVDPYGYSKLNTTELRKVVTDLTKDTLDMQEQKKVFSAGANDVIKENNTRVKAAIEALKTAELASNDKTHEKNVADFLKSVPSVSAQSHS